MSKNKHKRRQQSQQNNNNAVKKIKPSHNNSSSTLPSPPSDYADAAPGEHGQVKTLHTLVPAEDLEITIDTLNVLAENPNLIKSKACKDLRTAVYDFRNACTTGANASGALPPS
ncbi:hypothetical protein DH86_00000360 [Scytalidium sp. 3C]|nr:hypothetical protein DH86_00000360 [Scytalidium sp. 3C]